MDVRVSTAAVGALAFLALPAFAFELPDWDVDDCSDTEPPLVDGDLGNAAPGAAENVGLGGLAGFFAAGAAFLPSLRFRPGFSSVSSLVEKVRVSWDPVGVTWMKSPSAGSPRPTTLPDLPASTPTARDVNQTGGWRPAASSSVKY